MSTTASRSIHTSHGTAPRDISADVANHDARPEARSRWQEAPVGRRSTRRRRSYLAWGGAAILVASGLAAPEAAHAADAGQCAHARAFKESDRASTALILYGMTYNHWAISGAYGDHDAQHDNDIFFAQSLTDIQYRRAVRSQCDEQDRQQRKPVYPDPSNDVSDVGGDLITWRWTTPTRLEWSGRPQVRDTYIGHVTVGPIQPVSTVNPTVTVGAPTPVTGGPSGGGGSAPGGSGAGSGGAGSGDGGFGDGGSGDTKGKKKKQTEEQKK